MQRGKVTASSWLDNKVVTVMSTTSQPSATGTVLRRQKDGTHATVPCPEAIITYNQSMGGVDRGDQLRGYYNCKVKSRKFYKYIFYFLLDVSITNAFILYKNFHSSPTFNTIRSSSAVGKRADRRVHLASSSWSWWWSHSSPSAATLSPQDRQRPLRNREEKETCLLFKEKQTGTNIMVLQGVWCVFMSHRRCSHRLLFEVA
jgi:hypothetical protein